jgi:hypothetical protein
VVWEITRLAGSHPAEALAVLIRWSERGDSNSRPLAPEEKGLRDFSVLSIRVGVGRFCFVRVEFTPTCPPPALRV